MARMDKHSAHRQQTYMGNHQDTAGLSPTGNILRDTWVFDILPESETCARWTLDRIEIVYEKVCSVETVWQSCQLSAASTARTPCPQLRHGHPACPRAGLEPGTR